MTAALDTKFFSYDLDCELTVRQFMQRLLRRLWAEGEGFSGKRPFGNSGWEYPVIEALVRDGLVVGKLDEDGELIEHDDAQFAMVIADAIDAL